MGSFINALKGWMGGQDWKTTNLQTRLGAVTGPILLPVSEYRITGGMAGGSGVTEGKGTRGLQATAEVTVEYAPERTCESEGDCRPKGPGPCWWPTTDCSADSD